MQRENNKKHLYLFLKLRILISYRGLDDFVFPCILIINLFLLGINFHCVKNNVNVENIKEDKQMMLF